ncbi:MAG: hypothetical protein IPM71_07245 [Bacteroidota bacterium]|nr:MAG: hypothetical protein IPM71_07245 [Bacteroidota bacterium]
MKTDSKYTFVLLLLLLFFVSACIKDDIAQIEENLIITPTYSIPVGTKGFTFEELMEKENLDTLLSDTLAPPDSVFIYHNSPYQIPPTGYFDTLLLYYFDFSTVQQWVDDATYLMFRLNIENEIPSEMLVQTSFLDIDGNILFNILTPPGLTLLPSTPDGPYILSPYDTEALTLEEIQSLPSARFVQTYVRVLLQNQTTGVVYLPEEYMNVQMGIRIGLEKNLGE